MLSRRKRVTAVSTAGVVLAVTGLTLSSPVFLAPAQAAVSCAVTYTVSSSWGGGFIADVTLNNTGDAWSGWTVTWNFADGAQKVVSAWNTSATQSGTAVSASNVGYNGGVASGSSVTFGFQGAYGSSNPAPTGFAVNGVSCGDGGGTTTTTTSGGGTTTTSPTTTTSTSTTTSTTTTSTTTTTTTSTTTTSSQPAAGAKQVEDLNRGLVSVRSGSDNFVSWRLLGTDPADVAFNLYRAGTKVNSSPITNSTNYLDSGAASGSAYTVKAVVNGAEQASSENALQFGSGGYLDVPISPPSGGTTPDGVAYTYTANDASVGDLDGDGQLDIVLKWDPTNAKDNSQSGYTGNVFIDGIKLNGQRLWRIDLGRNIRAGAHYTQFQVYDYDGDGDAEIAMKTSDATRDGAGTVIGNSGADYRNSSGYVLTGNEFLTMFDGLSGRALSTVAYVPARGTVSSWGDSYGNRVDRFLAGTAYLDGTRPSVIMARGYYTRSVIVAWDFRNGSLARRWTFDSGSSTNGSAWTGQGNHQLAIGDLDGDGRDEVQYGAMAVDDNGAGLWTSGRGHGDALHLGDLIPSRAGLEVFKVDEDTTKPADWMADARTGAIIWSHASCNCDNGRGVSGDIYAGSAGAESWSSAVAGLSSSTGANLGRKPGSTNFLAWWDGDTTRELLDDTHLDKYGTSSDTRLLTGSGVHSNNGTKATPALSGDILGDWREEVIWATTSNTALRIYSTTAVTTTRITTLLHDPMYRVGLAWQNTAYNQPPHPSFFIGNGMPTAPRPNIYVR